MNPFQAWLMGSFDEPIAGLETSAHAERLFHDHALAARYGFATVWEAAGWRLAEQGLGAPDLSWLKAVLGSATRHGLQVAWTLLESTWPDDVDPQEVGPFAERLGRFAAAAASEIAATDPRPVHVYRPIRASAVRSTCAAGVRDADRSGADADLADALAAASRAATAAIRAHDPRAWIVVESALATPGAADGPDGLLIVPEPRAAASVGAAAEAQVHAFRSQLVALDQAWQLHRKPLVLFGTEAAGDARGPALETIAQAAAHAASSGIELHGICVSPLLDEPSPAGRPERRGLWSVDREGARLPEQAYARAISRCQRTLLPRRGRAAAAGGARRRAAEPAAASR
jgi:hypothetical protein